MPSIVTCSTIAAGGFRYYDQAITALVEDLYARGLDKKVMLVVTGEFGRTPRIEYQRRHRRPALPSPAVTTGPEPCRCSFPAAECAPARSSAPPTTKANIPSERPLKPEDLWATVYRHLGIDWTQTFPDHTRPPAIYSAGCQADRGIGLIGADCIDR